MVEMAGDHTYVQREIKKRKEDEWSSKGMNGCPLTVVHSICLASSNLFTIQSMISLTNSNFNHAC
jgi:hypothetical protein